MKTGVNVFFFSEWLTRPWLSKVSGRKKAQKNERPLSKANKTNDKRLEIFYEVRLKKETCPSNLRQKFIKTWYFIECTPISLSIIGSSPPILYQVCRPRTWKKAFIMEVCFLDKIIFTAVNLVLYLELGFNPLFHDSRCPSPLVMEAGM